MVEMAEAKKGLKWKTEGDAPGIENRLRGSGMDLSLNPGGCLGSLD